MTLTYAEAIAELRRMEQRGIPQSYFPNPMNVFSQIIEAVEAEHQDAITFRGERDRLAVKIAKNSLNWMPGAWICDKCGFILQKNVLHTLDGGVSADTKSIQEACPNDGQPMRHFTWREANEGLFAALAHTQALLKATEKVLEETQQQCHYFSGTKVNWTPQDLRLAEAKLAKLKAQPATKQPDAE